MSASFMSVTKPVSQFQYVSGSVCHPVGQPDSPKSENYSPLAVSLGQLVKVSSSENHLHDQLTRGLGKINQLARHSVSLTN